MRDWPRICGDTRPPAARAFRLTYARERTRQERGPRALRGQVAGPQSGRAVLRHNSRLIDQLPVFSLPPTRGRWGTCAAVSRSHLSGRGHFRAELPRARRAQPTFRSLDMNAPTEKLAADVKVLAADVEELIRATAAETGDRLHAARNRVQAALVGARDTVRGSGQGCGGDNGPLRAGKHVDRGGRIVRDRILRRPAGRTPLARPAARGGGGCAQRKRSTAPARSSRAPRSAYARKRSTETPNRGVGGGVVVKRSTKIGCDESDTPGSQARRVAARLAPGEASSGSACP